MKLSPYQTKVLNNFSSKSAKIHYLDKIRNLQNEKISNIGLAKILGIIPQHVYNELARVCKNPKEVWNLPIKPTPRKSTKKSVKKTILATK